MIFREQALIPMIRDLFAFTHYALEPGMSDSPRTQPAPQKEPIEEPHQRSHGGEEQEKASNAQQRVQRFEQPRRRGHQHNRQPNHYDQCHEPELECEFQFRVMIA